jgi:hypothetical protein
MELYIIMNNPSDIRYVGAITYGVRKNDVSCLLI